MISQANSSARSDRLGLVSQPMVRVIGLSASSPSEKRPSDHPLISVSIILRLVWFKGVWLLSDVGRRGLQVLVESVSSSV